MNTCGDLVENDFESKWYNNIHYKCPTLDEIEVIENSERADEVAGKILESQVKYCGYDCEWARAKNVGKVWDFVIIFVLHKLRLLIFSNGLQTLFKSVLLLMALFHATYFEHVASVKGYI